MRACANTKQKCITMQWKCITTPSKLRPQCYLYCKNTRKKVNIRPLFFVPLRTTKWCNDSYSLSNQGVQTYYSVPSWGLLNKQLQWIWKQTPILNHLNLSTWEKKLTRLYFSGICFWWFALVFCTFPRSVGNTKYQYVIKISLIQMNSSNNYPVLWL